MIEMISMLLKSGVKTSEFWLSLIALVLPYFADLGSDKVAAWTSGHGWIGGLVAAVYVAARAYVKGQTAKAVGSAATTTALPPTVQADATSAISRP
jgi:uncharacterized membrane protein YqaE (UPF0057 family)